MSNEELTGPFSFTGHPTRSVQATIWSRNAGQQTSSETALCSRSELHLFKRLKTKKCSPDIAKDLVNPVDDESQHM